jgi:hypothetical protein
MAGHASVQTDDTATRLRSPTAIQRTPWQIVKPWPDRMHAGGRLGGAWDVEPARSRRVELGCRGFRTCCASTACQPRAGRMLSAPPVPPGTGADGCVEAGEDVPGGAGYAGGTGHAPPEERAHLAFACLRQAHLTKSRGGTPTNPPESIVWMYICVYPSPSPLLRRIDATMHELVVTTVRPP